MQMMEKTSGCQVLVHHMEQTFGSFMMTSKKMVLTSVSWKKQAHGLDPEIEPFEIVVLLPNSFMR
jgi:hypothetical protein